jgi:hypothetical protein
MSDPISLLLAGDETADDAATTNPTADEQDPTVDLLSALGGLDAPEDEAGLESQDAEDEPDWRTRAAELEEKLQTAQSLADTEQAKREQQEQLQLMRQASDAWKQQDELVFEQASSKATWEEAAGTLVNHYERKIAQITNAAQQLLANAYSGTYLQQVAQDTGLSDEDKALLSGIDPKSVPAVAQALATKNKSLEARLAKIENDQQQLRRGQQSKRRAATGADRGSGTRGSTPPVKIVDGSDDHALLLYQATRLQRAQNRG